MLAAASTEKPKPELPCLGGAEARASGISDVFLCFLHDRRAIALVCESEEGSATAVQGVAAGSTYTNKQTEPSRGEAQKTTTHRVSRASRCPQSSKRERIASEILQGKIPCHGKPVIEWHQRDRVLWRHVTSVLSLVSV